MEINKKEKNTVIEIVPHTVLLYCGPSNSGKTHFTNALLSQLKEEKSIKVISSDEIRRLLLQDNTIHKHDNRMNFVSKQAFDILFSELNVYTSYPVNYKLVIVDTTGLQKEFRNKVYDIAKKNNYNVDLVLFTYNSFNDYLKNISSEDDKRIILNHVKKFRENTLSNLDVKKYHKVHKIRSLTSTFDASIKNLQLYNSNVNNDIGYYIIGDVHGCFNTFEIFLNTIYNSQNHIIFVGDVIDKGKDSKKMIEWIYENPNKCTLVKGNHENFVYKWLKGQLKNISIDEQIITNQFTSIKEFENESEEFLNKFYTVVERSVPFFKTNSFIVTHAPCETKYLGKLDNTSIKNQRSFRYDVLDTQALERELDFITKDEGHFPIHIFGHIPTQDTIKTKNHMGIDTGCVYGNKLTILEFKPGYYKPIEHVIPSTVDKIDKLLFAPFVKDLSKIKIEDVNIDDLDSKQRGRLIYLAKDKINFISGTMCPADKNVNTNELESLESGLNYYKNLGITEVLLEPKWMGSRCNVYLAQTNEDSYCVSRNGYKIDHAGDLTWVYDQLRTRFDDKFFKTIKMVILDCELLPWSLLGKGLIEEAFNVIDVGIKTELEFLKQNRFEESLILLRNKHLQDVSDKENLSKEEYEKKYNQTLVSTYQNLTTINVDTLSMYQKWYDTFHEQLELFAQPITEENKQIKPFAILKIIYKDDNKEENLIQESDYTNFYSYMDSQVRFGIAMLAKEEEENYCIVEFSNPNYLVQAKEFYNKYVTELKMEGIVIKPELTYYPLKQNIAPYLKVRNPDYLTLVYGYDYRSEKKYKKLMNQKSIRNKLHLSITEYELGKILLDFNRENIYIDNKDYINVCSKLILNIEKEKALDPRL